jgi:hypothetical protein
VAVLEGYFFPTRNLYDKGNRKKVVCTAPPLF